MAAGLLGYTDSSRQGADRPHLSAVDSPQVTDANGFLIPTVRTFNGLYNTFSRVYSYRFDEAVRWGRQNALAMRRDAYLRSLLQERLTPLSRWPWEITAEATDDEAVNPKDPKSTDREKVRTMLEACLRKTPRFRRLRRYLGEAVWYGRYASQFVWQERPVGGAKQWCVGKHKPINGDKIAFGWDGTPGVMVRAGDERGWPDVRMWDGSSKLAMLSTPAIRQRFVVHTHDLEDADFFEPQMAGRIEGIGLRDFSYWAWWLRDEMLSWLTDFMEKVGNLGLLLVYYEEGNPASKTKAEETAKSVTGKSALAVPRPKGGRDQQTAGVELIPANMAGVQFLKEIVGDYFEKHIERLFIGQTLSSGTEGSGLGGSGVAALHEDTKFQLLASDAEDLDETLTTDVVAVLKMLNASDAPGDYAFKARLPDPRAKDKLEAMAKLGSMPGKKLTYRAEEVRGLTGMTQPDEGDEIVGGEDELPDETGNDNSD